MSYSQLTLIAAGRGMHASASNGDLVGHFQHPLQAP